MTLCRAYEAVIERAPAETRPTPTALNLSSRFKPIRDVGEAKMRLLVEYLAWRGVSFAKQSQCLCFSGQNGERDMDAVIANHSGIVPRGKAFVVLSKKYNVTEDHLREQAARNAAEEAPPPVVDEMRMWTLVDYLIAVKRVYLPRQTEWLGFSGQNADSDMRAVVANKWRISRKAAYERLCEHFDVTEKALNKHFAQCGGRVRH